MYVRVFSEIVDSTLWFEKPCVFKLWTLLLIKADMEGDVWSCNRALMRDSLLTEDDFNLSISVLTGPDSESQTKGDGGKRIIPLSENRGWKIVNYKKYRDIKTKADLSKEKRKNYMREYMRDYRKTPSGKLPKQKGSKGKKLKLNPVKKCKKKLTPDVDVDVNVDVDHPSGEVKEFFFHFLKKTGRTKKQYKLTDKRRGKIRTRLKQFSLGELKIAVDRLSVSPFHAGDNDRGKKFDSLEDKWFRSYEDVDGWLQGMPIPKDKPIDDLCKKYNVQ